MPYKDSVAGGSKAITSDRGLYFINTDGAIPNKPVQIWTQGETESNSHWMPTIDKPNERFTTQIELTVPDSFQTLSNGAMISAMPAAKGLRTDIWKMDMPIQAYATMFAIGKFTVVKDKPWNGKEVSYYMEADYAPYAKLIFNHTREMMDFFSYATGVPYPWNKYSQVIARDYVSGAMENTTASLFGEFVNKTDREYEDGNNEDIVSHELFHQWFGDYATMESWTNLTVSESFANYGEQLWRRHFQGQDSEEQLAYDDLNGYLNSSKYNDPQLVRFYYRDKEEMFDRVSYNKGGATLRYLHGLIGDSAFFRSMKLYLTKNALQSTEATHWRLAVEEATGKDWNWFFNQWYYRAGHPELTIKYAYDDAAAKLIVTVFNRSSPDTNFRYRLPLKAGIINGNSISVVDWEITKKKEEFVYDYVNGKRPVVIPDYAGWLPGSIKEDKKLEDWLVQFKVAPHFINKRKALTAAFLNYKDPLAIEIYKLALNEGTESMKVDAMDQLGEKPLNESLKKDIIFQAQQSISNKVRAAAFDCLGEWKVSTIQQDMLEAVDSRSYLVAGSALNALYVVDKPEAYDKAKKMLDTNPRGNLKSAIWSVIAGEANDTDLAYFEKRKIIVYGNDRRSFAGSLTLFLSRVKDQSTFDKGMEMLRYLYTAEEATQLGIFAATSNLYEKLEKNSPRKPQVKAQLQDWLTTIKNKKGAQKIMDEIGK